MTRNLHYGVIAVALLGSSALAFAQENKAPQNSADEALVRSAPEAKSAPQAPPQISISPQASQPGLSAIEPVLVDGKLAVPGAPTGTQDEPAKFSAKNDAIDNLPTMAYPPALTAEQKQAIFQRVSEGQAPVSSISAKLSEQVPALTQLEDLPKDLADKTPSIRDYKFLRLQDKVLLVNPRESIVVGEITKQ
jgi:hypothetical protein